MTHAIARDLAKSVQECGWFGALPADWSIKPLKIIASVNDEVLAEDTDPDEEIQYVDISSVNDRGEIKTIDTMYFGKAPSRARRRVQHGDTIVSTVRTYLRAIARIVDPAPNLIVSTGFAVIRPRRATAVDADYLGWMLRSAGFVEQVVADSVGVSYPAIAPTRLGDISVPVPPAPIQQAIAAFLDRETARIDALIAKKRRLIELLREKRQAVISHTVTKGLDPNAPMKDSGVEWLGEIPAHWQMIPIKHAVEFREGPGIMAEDFTDDGIPLLRVASVSAERASLDGCNFLDPEKVKLRWKQFMVRKGDMLISASATMGTVSEVDDETVGSIPYTGIIILRPRPGMITREFIKMFVVSRAYISQIERLRAGATIQHYGPFHLRQIVMSLPPYDEQEAICKRMRTVIDEIEEVAAKAADAVTLMEEHRAALIAAAVTGKIDARGYVAKAVEAAE